MNCTNVRLAIAVFTGLSLQIATVASAHPGLYLVPARIAKSIETQTITVSATGGTFKPSAGASAVAYNAAAADVQAALEADPAIGFDNVTVTGNAGGPYTLTFHGAVAGTNMAQVVPNAAGLSGGAASAVAATAVDGGDDIVYPADFSTMAVQEQYAIANDGYATGVRETNGVATGGMVNYKMLPTAFRATMTKDQIVNYPAAQTSFQVHATCQGVPALADPTNIYAWQNDVFYNYIPWQKTSVGTGGEADPTKWIPVVQAATGVNLAALNTVAEFTAACAGIGGTYAAADAVSNIASANVADAVAAATAPLNAQIASLTGTNASLTTQNATLASQNAALQTQLDAVTRTDRNNATAIKALITEIIGLLKRIAQML